MSKDIFDGFNVNVFLDEDGWNNKEIHIPLVVLTRRLHKGSDINQQDICTPFCNFHLQN